MKCTSVTFNKAIDACEKLAQVKYTFNHSYYAKLAVREMLTEIYDGMIAAMEHQLGAAHEQAPSSPPPPLDAVASYDEEALAIGYEGDAQQPNGKRARTE